MNDTRGGDPDRIAPIIPLFGGGSKKQTHTPPPRLAEGDDQSTDDPRASDAAVWRTTWDAPPDSASHIDASDAGTPSDRHPARGIRGSSATASTRPTKSAPHLRALGGGESDDAGADEKASSDEVRVAAEESLVRKLRARSLSISEARQVLRGVGLDGAVVDEVIDDFSRRGYLDDAALAAVLVTSGVERKGQGRVALSRALAQRGIPRDVVDGALDELPDDDDDRALEFARGKARSMSRLDHDTALRRLVGQLSRRGYNGAVAMKAAKAALRGNSFGGSTSGVRFVDSD